VKRMGSLYESIADMENLRLAFWKARQGKEGKPDVEEFRRNLHREIATLRDVLLEEGVVWGAYHRFTIKDPKERLICAAPFRDRVLHHAIMNLCEPVFERRQIFDSYACRAGKGLHACLDRAKRCTRRCRWYLKLDVRKYFDSIPHEKLKESLARLFKDSRLLRLFSTLVDGYESAPGRGIPIGNLTSQFFANEYLAGLDHRCKEILRIDGYVRYMDDFVLWSDDKETLKEAERSMRRFCLNELSLELKPGCLNECARGVSMLGCRVFPKGVLLARRSRRRFADKLRRYWRALEKGVWTQEEFAAHALPLSAYAGHADSLGFRQKIMADVGCSP